MQKFSEAAEDGRCPNCGYAVMKPKSVQNAARAAGKFYITGGLLGPAVKVIKCQGCGTKFQQG
jgi:ribosomal protein S27E